jgi:hypothetical protein
MTGTDSFEARYAAMRKELHGRVGSNKGRILEALKKVSAARAVLAYEGSGDSGQVEACDVYNPNDDIVEAQDAVACLFYRRHEFNESAKQWESSVVEKATPLKDALIDFAHELLEDNYPGWEINDGSRGEITIDVASGKVLIEHTNFYTESETTEVEC